MWTYAYSDELYHYGVKGMKWGVRRYQNPDGTLTAAGAKRQAKIGATLESRGDAYSNRASFAINKQQKLQSKRFDKYRKSDGDDKYSVMSKKETVLFDKYVKNSQMADKMYKIRDAAVKDLSEKQIREGQRYVTLSPAIGYLLAGPVGVGVLSAIDESRANQYIREYDRK